MQQPTMFCHDGTTIYYPTGPGRVHMITIAALADCDGSDEDLSDSTKMGDVTDLAMGLRNIHDGAGTFSVSSKPWWSPQAWPRVHFEEGGVITQEVDQEATAQDFQDALEQWADWCDRDAARLDSLDAIMGAIERAA